jgi:uncharacterized protein (DUF2267 family)
MTHAELIDAVREHAALDDVQAERALEASLESFGERLSGGAADELAKQLPDRDAAALRRRASGQAAPGGAIDLAQHIAERAGVAPADGANVLQAAMRAMTAAVRVDRFASGRRVCGAFRTSVAAFELRTFCVGRRPSRYQNVLISRAF